MKPTAMIEVDKEQVEAMLRLFDVLNADILSNLEVAKRHIQPLVELVGEMREARFDIACQEEDAA